MDDLRERLQREYGGPAARPSFLTTTAVVPAPETAAVDDPQVMVALFPPLEVAQKLALAGGEAAEELHITLAYLGRASEIGTSRRDQLVNLVADLANYSDGPLPATVQGIGLFNNSDGPVTWAVVDVPGMAEFRQRLVESLGWSNFALPSKHGWQPHMTLAYADRRDVTPEHLAFAFSSISVQWGDFRVDFPLMVPVDSSQDTVALADYSAEPDQKDDKDDPDEQKAALQVSEREPEAPAAEVTTAKAFVTEVAKRTFVTAPAGLGLDNWPTPKSPNQHMAWLEGRLVGAETPNRNNAMWTTADLQMSEPTVANGPLNWLHEERHIIGTLAESKFIPGASDREAAGVSADPHIVTLAAMWTWIYPQEMWVIQQAAGMDMLWLSMECVAEKVRCAGPEGCGRTVSYDDYLAGKTCDHLRERSSIKGFLKPTFLGAGVILPPARPGWADADARLLKQAASFADDAFEKAGRPDIPASQWESMVADVLQLAEVTA